MNDTIFSLSTPQGTGALAIVRVSGQRAFESVQAFFRSQAPLRKGVQRVFFGPIFDGETLIDEAVITIYHAPHSFTKEDTVEISCHNSQYIISTLFRLLLAQGLSLAKPGEFTQRAFLNGRFDLAQAEAVADLIAADTRSAHQAAMNQMRGGFSKEIKQLREKLIEFASLLELELDFGEEDVEFAKRDDLLILVEQLQTSLLALIQSFQLGNTLKEGVPTVIAGKPNAGKSTLLNALLNEERAIVSEIPGTTRDLIEDQLIIEGIKFRLVDTAGLRETTDVIEAMGVARTRQRMQQASIIVYVFDAPATTPTILAEIREELQTAQTPFILVGNKLDVLPIPQKEALQQVTPVTWISAATRQHVDRLKQTLVAQVQRNEFTSETTVITNARHYQHLSLTYEALNRVQEKIDRQVSSDWLALDVRDALHQLGEITGEITTDDLLATIFSKFCIGK